MPKTLRRQAYRALAQIAGWPLPESIGKDLPIMQTAPESQKVNANDFITQSLARGQTILVSRFGYTELNQLCHISSASMRTSFYSFSHQALLGQHPYWGGKKGLELKAKLSSSTKEAEIFLGLFVSAMKEISLLGSWANGESHFRKALTNVKVSSLKDLEPWWYSHPWTSHLKDKTVLVVSPFSETIIEQYSKNKDQIFPESDVLPAFHLKTVKAFLPGVRDSGLGFIGTFQKLTAEVLAEDFDVAIVGSGPNGMLLSAEIKKAGKSAIHLGGSTQLLFGIRGKRWEKQGFPFFNESWIRPSKSETPDNYASILDQGAYW